MEEQYPLFSIIVPVYNAEQFVAETIENLLKQNVSKEILLVNDGSTDLSLKILKEYSDQYSFIKVIDKPNGGVSKTRNVGINAALGKYILFVDSDDFIEENILEKCLCLFERYDIDAAFFSYKYCFPGTDKQDISIKYKRTGLYTISDWLGDFYNLSQTCIINCIGTTIYKKEILDKFNIRFNENISYYEDIGFCTEYLGRIQQLYFINETAYWYRFINSNSLISKYRVKFVDSLMFLRQKQIELFEHAFYKQPKQREQLYQVFGCQIIDNIFNLIKYPKESASVIDRDLSTLSLFPELLECIKTSKSDRNKILLWILKNASVRQMKLFYKTYFFLITNVKRFVRCLK